MRRALAITALLVGVALAQNAGVALAEPVFYENNVLIGAGGTPTFTWGQLTLQTAVAVRERIVQSYQMIMQMPM